MIQRYIISLALFSFIITGASAQHFSFDNFSVKDGLIQSNVNAIVQDNNGFVWFATDGGLSKFDGSKFINYTAQNGLLDTKVSALCKDALGNIWIGYTNGKISVYSPRTDTVVEYALSNLHPSRIFSIYRDRKENLWVSTLGAGAVRLMKKDSSARSFVAEKFSPSNEISDNVYNIYQDSNGTMWFLTNQGIVKYNEAENKTEHFKPEDLPSAEYVAITEDAQKNIWMGSWGGGVMKISFTNGVPTITNKSSVLPNLYVSSLITLSSGEVIAGTWGGGFYQFQNDETEIISDANGLIGNKIHCLFEDREHNLWLGMQDNGACYFKGKRFSVFGMAEGMKNENVNALLQDAAGNIWVGTNDGIELIGDGNKILSSKKISLNQFSTTEQVNSLAWSSDHQIIAGTFGGGAVIINPVTMRATAHVPIADKYITAIAPVSQRIVWFGSVTGLTAFNFSANDFEALPDNNTVNQINVACIFKENDISIWIGTRGNGLIHFDGNHFIKVGSDQGFAALSPTSVCKDNSGALWIGTEGEGLYKFAQGKFTRFNTSSGLSSDFITLLQPDASGNIWLGTNTGLDKFDAQKNIFNHFGKEEGFTPQETRSNSCLADANGNLWFGTSSGAVFYQSKFDKSNSIVPVVSITGIFFGTENYLNRSEIVFPHTHNSLSIYFNAICFSGKDKVRYQYQLEGLNTDWQPITNLNFAVYSYLEPGKYTFKLRACNNNDVWTDNPVTVSFSITPPFWRTTWFYVVCVLGALLTVLLIVRVRTTSLINQRNKMEHMVTVRTEELHTSNEQLANTIHKLKDTQLQLIQAEKMSSLGQLTAGIAHEINNPINFVSANIQPLKRDVDDVMKLLEKYSQLNKDNFDTSIEEILSYRKRIDLDYTLDEIKTLMKGIEEGSHRTASIVKGLRNFSRLDEDVLKHANINEGIQSTLLLLQNKFDEKNIGLVKQLNDMPDIECYPEQLNQVFMNLFTNAIDANHEGGKIFVTTNFIPSPDEPESGKGFVRISVRDTGQGMSAEVKQKIFDPFFTTKDVGKGTGLGLSISFGIIEKHNGKIDVKSEPGKGTEFIISLPSVVL